MSSKMIVFVLLASLSVTSAGCLALVAAGAGGGGTAVWLSGKLTQEVKASVDEAFTAAKKALDSLDLETTKATLKRDVAQVMGVYDHPEGPRTIWIDVHRISDARSRIGVRVGAISDKEAARQILDEIVRYL